MLHTRAEIALLLMGPCRTISTWVGLETKTKSVISTISITFKNSEKAWTNNICFWFPNYELFFTVLCKNKRKCINPFDLISCTYDQS